MQRRNAMLEAMNKESSYKIQLLRGLAIMAVVTIHNVPAGLPQVFIRPFVNFSVGLFLFLSGLLSDAKKWQPKKRIVKVLIPYIIWSLIYVGIRYYKTPEQLPLAYLKALLTANASAALYYIFVYIELTLCIPIIDKLARSKAKWIGFLISPLEIAALRMLPLITGREVNGYLGILMNVSCLGWFTYFYLGYLLGNGLLELKMSPKKLCILLGGSIALQIQEGWWYYSLGSQNCGTQLKLSSVLSGILFCFLAYHYILSFLGNHSFGIYLSHLAVMAVLDKIPYYKQIAVFPMNAAAALLLSCACAAVFGKLLGKGAKYFGF